MEATPTTPSLGAGEFVAISIGNLSTTPAVERQDSTTNPRIQLHSTLSRKGFPTGGDGGGDTKTAASGGAANSAAAGGPTVRQECGVHVHVDRKHDVSKLSHASTPTAAAGGAGRGRRVGRRNSPWLDPRRVLLAFATMSVLGSLVLLYFTLSIGKMTSGDDANS